jgi:hypothetical protein
MAAGALQSQSALLDLLLAGAQLAQQRGVELSFAVGFTDNDLGRVGQELQLKLLQQQRVLDPAIGALRLQDSVTDHQFDFFGLALDGVVELKQSVEQGCDGAALFGRSLDAQDEVVPAVLFTGRDLAYGYVFVVAQIGETKLPAVGLQLKRRGGAELLHGSHEAEQASDALASREELGLV